MTQRASPWEVVLVLLRMNEYIYIFLKTASKTKQKKLPVKVTKIVLSVRLKKSLEAWY